MKMRTALAPLGDTIGDSGGVGGGGGSSGGGRCEIIVEGVSNGVPFLSWPAFADQFTNKTYICDVWNVGLGLKKDDKGIITREEIINKVEILLGNHEFAEKDSDLKGKIMSSIGEGGRTYKNMSDFLEWIKGEKS
ncbi:hypothetical protein LguiA_017287 [Lonicera macranthoides]